MANVLREALDREEPFTILWDLRRLVPPSLSALDYGSKWQSENSDDIERLGQSIVVLVSSPVTRVCANLCVRACNPPQPIRICGKEEEAIAFAKEQHEKVLRLRGGSNNNPPPPLLNPLYESIESFFSFASNATREQRKDWGRQLADSLENYR